MLTQMLKHKTENRYRVLNIIYRKIVFLSFFFFFLFRKANYKPFIYVHVHVSVYVLSRFPFILELIINSFEISRRNRRTIHFNIEKKFSRTADLFEEKEFLFFIDQIILLEMEGNVCISRAHNWNLELRTLISDYISIYAFHYRSK